MISEMLSPKCSNNCYKFCSFFDVCWTILWKKALKVIPFFVLTKFTDQKNRKVPKMFDDFPLQKIHCIFHIVIEPLIPDIRRCADSDGTLEYVKITLLQEKHYC